MIDIALSLVGLIVSQCWYRHQLTGRDKKIMFLVEIIGGLILNLYIFEETVSIPSTIEFEALIIPGYKKEWGYFCEGVLICQAIMLCYFLMVSILAKIGFWIGGVISLGLGYYVVRDGIDNWMNIGIFLYICIPMTGNR